MDFWLDVGEDFKSSTGNFWNQAVAKISGNLRRWKLIPPASLVMQKLLINKIINGHKIKLKLTIKLWTPAEVNFSGVFSYVKVTDK